MIATILKLSKDFSAVDYNERKADKGTAELIAMRNFGILQKEPGMVSQASLKEYLLSYSFRNEHIQYPQFHVAISCRGDEYSPGQLEAIAWKYLKEMGYGEEGQPVLMYFHRDTDNNHLHIITSRIAPDGHKIEHDHERIRSLKAINRIMGVDERHQYHEALSNALSYRFENMPQFMAVLETSGYECYIEEDKLMVKQGGCVAGSIPVREIEKRFSKKDKSLDRRKKQLSAVMRKYQEMAAGSEEFQRMLRQKFGTGLKFLGKEGSPYGYIIVDHATKTVFKGGEVLPLKELLQFHSRAERLEMINTVIRQIMEETPKITSRGLSGELRRELGVYISKGHVIMGDKEMEIAPFHLQTLKYNDLVHWVQSFSPQTDTERTILAEVFKVKAEDLTLGTLKDDAEPVLELVRQQYDRSSPDNICENLNSAGLFVFQKDGSHYCIDRSRKVIVNLEANGIDISKPKERSHGLPSPHTHSIPRKIRVDNGYGSKDGINYNPDADREYDDGIDDGQAHIRRS